jgi:hypothetical protein
MSGSLTTQAERLTPTAGVPSFCLRHGYAPGRMHFHKGQSGGHGGDAGGTSLLFAALAPALRTESELLGDAGEGEFAGQGDRLFPERLRNPAVWRAPAPPPLGKLPHDVVQGVFRVGWG